jgi:hypothetical protein
VELVVVVEGRQGPVLMIEITDEDHVWESGVRDSGPVKSGRR